MREIKFRAWTLEKKMKQDVIPLNSKKILGTNGPYGVPSQPAKVMQYTGLKDKSGKEIYEGDIIKHHEKFMGGEETDSYYEVYYGKENCGCCEVVYGFSFKPVRGTKYESDSRFYKYAEVIGNIYENPKLVK